MFFKSFGGLFFLYDLFGNYFPERIMHRGFSFNEIVAFIYGGDGIFGVIANVYASYVFLFILFGVFLEMTKVGDVFVNLAFSLVGRHRGGAAKASVVSSGLVGTVVGSGAANICITGVFTIPLMKRIGFPAHYAGAVEAVSSIGGHLMPPVMGSAAFLVAAFTETSYNYIALVSIVPAFMYYFAVYSSVHNQAALSRGVPIPVNGDLVVARGGAPLPAQQGQKVRIQTSSSDPLGNEEQVIGGGPLLLQNGGVVLNGRSEGFSAGFLSLSAPRTVVAQDQQRIWLMTLEGSSSDPTLLETSLALRQLGITDALNLDEIGRAHV